MASCSYASIDTSIARATCVYVNVCMRAGRERTIRVLLRRIVSRHTPGWRLRVHLFGQKDLVGPPCPSSRLCSWLAFILSPSHPLRSSAIIIHCIFLPPIPLPLPPRVSIDNPRENHDALCRPASFSKLSPRV